MKTTHVVVVIALVAPCSFVLGMHHKPMQPCVETLVDGRKLLSVVFDLEGAKKCKYSAPPSRYEVSAEELRRMARAKERLDRVK